jgi:hypothetical protein
LTWQASPGARPANESAGLFCRQKPVAGDGAGKGVEWSLQRAFSGRETAKRIGSKNGVGNFCRGLENFCKSLMG